jgi:hypothetical protein
MGTNHISELRNLALKGAVDSTHILKDLIAPILPAGMVSPRTTSNTMLKLIPLKHGIFQVIFDLSLRPCELYPQAFVQNFRAAHSMLGVPQHLVRILCHPENYPDEPRSGYVPCRQLTGPDFQSVFNLQLWASNAKLINYYMIYGCVPKLKLVSPCAHLWTVERLGVALLSRESILRMTMEPLWVIADWDSDCGLNLSIADRVTRFDNQVWRTQETGPFPS